MKTKLIALALLIATLPAVGKKKVKTELFPDGTPIPAWFSDTTKVSQEMLGKRYVITEYGVSTDSTVVQTERIQAVINKASQEGGGVVVVPKGVFLSGSLFFKQGVNLLVEEGGMLKGSDRIRDFKLVETRMEGQTLKYFAALVNADDTDGFTIAGKGTIRALRERFPKANIVPIDYDPSATRVNQENRLKLMLAVARENLSEVG